VLLYGKDLYREAKEAYRRSLKPVNKVFPPVSSTLHISDKNILAEIIKKTPTILKKNPKKLFYLIT
jgi:hypothetical protein